ncbi:hypothetical protein E3N88_22254 [Mikania micrantha]|uniref:Zinc finger GRF-type domain-containing protein n=1 Tax=Mikania micrantha TaxID=192012 RepID=A0A5N6NBF7_9ASTR|nr:hypothetical protein E3N88_22254 [Mikania micrantha]
MSSISSTAHSVNKNPKIFKVDLDGNLYYKSDLIVVRRVVQRKSSRIGQEFYGCPLWPNMDCKFFLWKEDLDTMCREHESYMTNLLPENLKSYDVMKMRNSKLEKMLLTAENKHLKEMLQKSKTKYKIRNILGLPIGLLAGGSEVDFEVHFLLLWPFPPQLPQVITAPCFPAGAESCRPRQNRELRQSGQYRGVKGPDVTSGIRATPVALDRLCQRGRWSPKWGRIHVIPHRSVNWRDLGS